MFDPVAEVPHRHREFPDTKSAVAQILAENPQPRVYAIGEYHPTRNAIASASPLARFTQDGLPAIAEHVSDLVVETWFVDPTCGQKAQTATAKVEMTVRRPHGAAVEEQPPVPYGLEPAE